MLANVHVLLLTRTRRTSPPRSGKASLNNLEKMRVLKRGLHPLLVVQLLVDGVLRLVGSRLNADVDLVSAGEGA